VKDLTEVCNTCKHELDVFLKKLEGKAEEKKD